MVLSDNLHTEKIGDKRIIGDKKSAINNSRLYSRFESTACVLFLITINYSPSLITVFDIS